MVEDFGDGFQSPEMSPVSLPAAAPEGELFLRFFVTTEDEFALPATGIHRILEQSPDRISPIANVSNLLLGTLNEQGRVVWVADLGQFLGYPAPLNTDRPEVPIVIVEDQGTMLGLAINRIVGTQWLDPDQTIPLGRSTDSMDPFLRGGWALPSDDGKVLRLLNHVAVIRSARWAA